MARYEHMAGPRKPTWMPKWCLHGVNSDIVRSGLNRAIGQLKSHGVESASWARSHQFHAIQRLKSHGEESASWATIPPILRDSTGEITRSEIRVVGHGPPISHKLLYK